MFARGPTPYEFILTKLRTVEDDAFCEQRGKGDVMNGAAGEGVPKKSRSQ